MIIETKYMFPEIKRKNAIANWLNKHCKGKWDWADSKGSLWPTFGHLEFELASDAAMYKIVWE